MKTIQFLLLTEKTDYAVALADKYLQGYFISPGDGRWNGVNETSLSIRVVCDSGVHADTVSTRRAVLDWREAIIAAGQTDCYVIESEVWLYKN